MYVARYVIAFRIAVLASIHCFAAFAPMPAPAQAEDVARGPITDRNIGISRGTAAERPRSESDQALADGWPLYRTERGQQAFNAAMATLAATEGKPPGVRAFKDCVDLQCPLVLPPLSTEGWLPTGRIWVSPAEYVLVAHSPRIPEGRSWRRRSQRQLRYFVLHEFHNSTRNNDLFDTVSSHSGAVFVPFYMSKQQIDAKGCRFVIVLQVAPYDVQSIHATNLDSAGPGIEVAKSAREDLEPLQARAGIVVASILETAAPQLRVVNHRGYEGKLMLDAYEQRRAALASRPSAAKVTLPFVQAATQRLASADLPLYAIVTRGGASQPVPLAERGVAPPVTFARASLTPTVPQLVGPIRPAVRPTTAISASEPQLAGPIVEVIRPTRLRGAVAR